MFKSNRLYKKRMYTKVLFVGIFVFFGITSLTFASTATYTPANFSLDSNAAIYGGSNVRTASGNLYLNWNRPAVDANHVGYWNFDDGTGTAAADVSSQNNTGTLVGGSTKLSWSGVNSSYSYAGSNFARFSPGKKITLSNTSLDFEKTQPWTVMSAVRTNRQGSTQMIFSNVKDSPFPGYEFWINPSNHLHVRIINNISNNYIGVQGTTTVTDNNWHFVTATYDGSGTAAGVKIYLDGVAETTTVESDTLTGSIVGPGPFVIGNQTDWESTFYLGGALDEFSLSNVVRSPSYISQYSIPSSLPPVDANTLLNYHFDEGSGLTTADTSATNRTATLNDALIWPASNTWLGNYALRYNGSTGAYVTMPHVSAYTLGSQFTLSSWANSEDSPNAGTIFYKMVNSGGFPGWAFNAGYLNKMQWWNGAAFSDSTVAATKGWHQYAIRFNSGTLEFIIDGTVVKTNTSVATPTASPTQPLLIGSWNGGATWQWNGNISTTTISNTNRSNGYMTSFAKRYPTEGVASLANVSTAVGSGGGDLGQDSSITNFSATFSKPTTTNLQYRIGSGSSAVAATADKAAQSFVTLNSSNSISKTGRYVDYDIKLASSSDTLGQDTPYLTNVSLTYAASDATAPTLTEVTPVSTPTNDATPNYTFSTDEAGTILYGGSCSSATTSATSGSNTITFNTLSDGTYTNCTITVTDAASNASTPLSVTSFTVDTAAPTVSTLSPADNATGVSPTANLVMTFNQVVTTNTGNIIIKKTSDDSTIETIAVGSGQVTGSGTSIITINPSVTLASVTEYYVQVDSGAFRDAALNSYAGISSTTAWSFTAADTTSPSISLTTPSNAEVVSGSISVSATASDNVGVSGVQFKLDGSNLQSEDTTSTYGITWDTTSTSDGSHTLTAVARDAAGNTATSSSVVVTVDNTAPVRSSLAPSGTLSYNTTSTNLTLSTNESAVCKYSTSSGTAYGSMTSFGTTNSTSHSTSISGLTNATSYAYYVKCADALSNTNATDATISFAVAADSDAPLLSSITATSITQTGATITWTTDELASSQVSYGTTSSYGTTTTETDTSPRVTSHSVALSGLTANTEYHYQVISTDGTTNTTMSTDQTFTTSAVPDTTPPDTFLTDTPTDPSSDTTPTFTFEANESSTFECSVDEASYVSCVSPYTTTTLAVGPHSFAVRATDLAENTDASPAAYEWTIEEDETPTPTPSRSSSGSYSSVLVVRPPSTDTTACRSGDVFSSTTGARCTSPTTPSTLPTFHFTRSLQWKMTGEDVRQLQIYLNTHGYPVAPSGVGSRGYETNYFGLATKAALIKFQIANKIVPSVGFFGPVTRGFVESHL